MIKEFPPIVLFVYNRPLEFKKAFDSLLKCIGIENHKIIIFCDGPKNKLDKIKTDEVLEYLKSFEKELRQLVEETVSIHDTANNPEAFYHGLMMGLTASLSRNEQYALFSNRESGYGRFDYMIFSHDKNKLSILIEFKKINTIKNLAQLTTHLEKAAAKALLQIDEKRYIAMAENLGCRTLLKIGLAFSGKHFALCHAYKYPDPDIAK